MSTSDRNTPHKDTETLVVPVAAGAKIPAGAIAMANTAGYGVPGATSGTLTYLGRADVSANNADGADGDVSVTVRRKKAFQWLNSATDPVTQADLFKTCYVVDAQTVAKTNGGNTRSAAGRVVGVDAGGVWVE